jgi:hypothetical protein
MAVTLDNTISGWYANSYADLVYADSYWEDHYSSTKTDQWSALSDEQKTHLMLVACSVIERYKFTATGFMRPPDYWHSEFNRQSGLVVQLTSDNRPIRAAYRQKLQFPRSFDYTIDGVWFIPDDIMRAQCEQAMYILNFDEDSMSQRLQGITQNSLTVGSVHVSQTFSAGGSALAPMAREILSQYFFVSNSWRRA